MLATTERVPVSTNATTNVQRTVTATVRRSVTSALSKPVIWFFGAILKTARPIGGQVRSEPFSNIESEPALTQPTTETTLDGAESGFLLLSTRLDALDVLDRQVEDQILACEGVIAVETGYIVIEMHDGQRERAPRIVLAGYDGPN